MRDDVRVVWHDDDTYSCFFPSSLEPFGGRVFWDPHTKQFVFPIIDQWTSFASEEYYAKTTCGWYWHDYGSYQDYLKSSWYLDIRNYVRRRSENRCQMCGNSKSLHCHHSTYRLLGTWEEELTCITLCAKCHKGIHSYLKYNGQLGHFEHRDRGWNKYSLPESGLAYER